MPELTIKNAPQDKLRALEAIAERTNKDVSAVALGFLPKLPPISQEQSVASLRALRGSGAGDLHPDSTTLIRRDRDGVSENELSPADALRICRELRGKALQPRGQRAWATLR